MPNFAPRGTQQRMADAVAGSIALGNALADLAGVLMGQAERSKDLAGVHAWCVVVDQDQRLLNDVEGLGIPTMENIARFVWEKLGALKQLQRVVVKRGQNGEGCEYCGPG